MLTWEVSDGDLKLNWPKIHLAEYFNNSISQNVTYFVFISENFLDFPYMGSVCYLATQMQSNLTLMNLNKDVGETNTIIKGLISFKK